MIIVDKDIDIAIVESKVEAAKSKFDLLSECYTKDDITQVAINLSQEDPELAIALGSLNEQMQLDEFMVKHVSSRGEITRTHDLKTRQIRATQTTGLTKAARRQIARKAQKTKRANPGIQTRALRKKKRAMAKRRSLGLS